MTAAQPWRTAARVAQAGPRVLVVGDLILDDWWAGSTERLSREAPVPVVTAGEHRLAAGGAANTAVNLAALGARVAVVGLLGHDEAGAQLLRLLEDAGVDTAAVVCDERVRTPRKTRIVAGDAVVVRVDEGAAGDAEAPGDRLADVFRTAAADGAAQLVCDYGLGTAEALRVAILEAPRPALRVVDAHDPAAWAALEPDVVTPNFEEAQRLLGRRHEGGPRGDWLRAQHAQLVAAAGVRAAVAATLDHDGSLVLPADGSAPHSHPAVLAPERQASGAGDTFTAALTAALAAGCPLADAAAFAQAAADVVVRDAGTSVCAGDALLTACRGLVTDRDVLREVVQAHRRLGRRVVFTNGVFDILHRGHASYLAEAKQAGDVLVVAINDDASVRRLKGAERPINSERDRAEVISALEAVDLVTVFAEDTPEALLSVLRPDVYVKGGDYSEQMLAEAQLVRGYGGDVRLLGYVQDHSTTELVERIRRPARSRRGAERWAVAEEPCPPELDVLIPTRNRPAELAVTLAGLAAQDDPPFRVVIGDQSDGRPDWEEPAVAAMVRVLRAQGRPVETLRTLPARGLAEHRQRLLEHSVRTAPEAAEVLFLDDDVWLEPGQLPTLVAARRRLGCGFVGTAVQGLSYLDDPRPHEVRDFEPWDGGVQPEELGPDAPGFARWRLHNAANLAHLAAGMGLEAGQWVPYKVAWVGGCVLFDRAALVEAGGFDFWRQLPSEHAGEDVVAQWRVMARRGGAGLLPSGAVHLEAPTTIPVRDHDAKERIDIMAQSPNPIQVQKFLSGLDYPVDKNTLLDRARQEGADDNVLSALEGIPDKEYDAPTAVSEAVSNG